MKEPKPLQPWPQGSWVFRDKGGSTSVQVSSTWFIARVQAARALGCPPEDLTVVQDQNK